MARSAAIRQNKLARKLLASFADIDRLEDKRDEPLQREPIGKTSWNAF
jgi:hypothetical protein